MAVNLSLLLNVHFLIFSPLFKKYAFFMASFLLCLDERTYRQKKKLICRNWSFSKWIQKFFCIYIDSSNFVNLKIPKVENAFVPNLLNIRVQSSLYKMCSEHLLAWLKSGKIISHKAYFIMKYWISHVVDWRLYWEWKTEWLSGYRMIVKASAVYPWDHVASWEPPLPNITKSLAWKKS